MALAVITGGASGLGRALGDRCAARGMDVALLDLDGDRADQEAAAIAGRHGVTAVGLATDVGDVTSVDRAARRIDERFGAAQLVVSNVGVTATRPWPPCWPLPPTPPAA
jgi:NAD(P)-dependent dehydrogenase (short-subunit alcohol dehydrogenase family)